MSKQELRATIAAAIIMAVGITVMIFVAINGLTQRVDAYNESISRSVKLIHKSEYPQCATEISISEDRINYSAFVLHAMWVASCEIQMYRLEE